MSPPKIATSTPTPRSAKRTGAPIALACAGTLLGVILGAPLSPALAQERIHAETLPDLDLVESLMPPAGNADESGSSPRLLWDLEGSIGQAPGTQAYPALGHGRLRWGMQTSPLASLATSIETRSALWLSGNSNQPLSGRHDLRGRLRTRTESGLGMELTAHGRFAHLGDERPALSPADLGPRAAYDQELTATVMPGFCERGKCNGDNAFALPIRAGVRRIDYRSQEVAVQRAETHTVAVGFGPNIVDRHAIRGLVELVGISHSRLRHSPAPGAMEGAPASEPRSVSITDLYFSRIDLAFVTPEMRIAGTGAMGWSWLRTDSGRRINMWTGTYGALVRSADADAELGIGLGRTPRISADGERLLADYRVDLHLALMPGRTGFLVRASAAWLSDQEQGQGREEAQPSQPDPGVLGRYAAHAELFHALAPGVRAGAYALAAYEAAGSQEGDTMAPSSWDPWQGDKRWGGQVGLFVRWSASTDTLGAQ